MALLDAKYDHKQVESRISDLWQQEEIFLFNPEATINKNLYSVDTPPPTVSGSLHIGHVFSYTQADIMVRYHRLCNDAIYYPFGSDDNGLPTERFVEKKRDMRAHTMLRSDFIRTCLEETSVAKENFINLLQRLGLSMDWNQTYSTIDKTTQIVSQLSFLRLLEKGHVYRKDEPAPFCTACRTSVAQAELDDATKTTVFHDITFSLAQDQNKKFTIATTRPELLPSCVAIFYHPQDTRYQHLSGKALRVPLFEQEVPCLADEKVVIEKGSGLVMCCTFGDSTDVEWFKKYKLPYIPSIGRDGIFLPTAGILAGLKVSPAREKVVEELQKQGLITAQKSIEHSVHIHERCKNPVEYLSLKQWFLNIMDHKQEFLDCADKINWHPSFMKSRYINWVQNIHWDWCLSRQRFYGIPFPIWYCAQCDEIIIPDEKQLPLDPQETHYQGTCTKCGSSNIKPDTDVMDTWNTSSLTPYINKVLIQKINPHTVFDAENNSVPMSMRPHAHDIIRTWTFYTIVKSWLHDKTIPWKNLMISGHVLAQDGKISKSQGNSPLIPENLLKLYPVDAIRYWTAKGMLGQDTMFADTQLKMGQRLVVKLWNAFRFIQEHMKEEEAPIKDGVFNGWIMHRASETFDQYKRYFDTYDYTKALDTVDQFFWSDVCDNYIECIKDSLFNPQKYDATLIKETRYTLYQAGLRILQMYAPFVPHVTDEIYQQLYRDTKKVASIHIFTFESIQNAYSNDSSVLVAHDLLKIIESVRRMKTQAQLSLKTPLQRLTIGTSKECVERVRDQVNFIAGICGAAQIIFVEEYDFVDHVCEEQDGYIMGIVLK